MGELIETLRGIDDFSCASAEPIVLDWIASKGYHLGNVMNAFRLAVVGECKGPTCLTSRNFLAKTKLYAASISPSRRIKA